MADPDHVNAGVAAATLKLLVRAGVIEADDVIDIADEHDRVAGFSAHDRETNEAIAHQLRCILLDLEPAPDTDPAIEFQVQQRRRQMRERTAYIDQVRPE